MVTGAGAGEEPDVRRAQTQKLKTPMKILQKRKVSGREQPSSLSHTLSL